MWFKMTDIKPRNYENIKTTGFLNGARQTFISLQELVYITLQLIIYCRNELFTQPAEVKAIKRAIVITTAGEVLYCKEMPELAICAAFYLPKAI